MILRLWILLSIDSGGDIWGGFMNVFTLHFETSIEEYWNVASELLFCISIFESAVRVFLEGFVILRVRLIESRLCICVVVYVWCILYQFYMYFVGEDI
jgi:hypothetical protein